MKIILATDGSDHSRAATEEIANRPFPDNTEVRIISAFASPIPYMYTPLPTGGMGDYYEEAKSIAQKAAKEAVENAAKLLQENNATLLISTAVINGSAKQAILEQADIFGADLIVVGSHGRGSFERFLLGSVSQAVALHAKCSVEIVRKQGMTEGDK
ncbi:MAG: universal stress protein [Cyclobacteriaceae bacterium]